MAARICSSRDVPAMSRVDFCTSSIRPSTEFGASSARPIAFAYRRSILSRTSSSDGVLPGAESSDIDSSEAGDGLLHLGLLELASSLVRSASFCCSSIALFSTALLACAAACSAWSCSVFRSSIDCSAETSWVAKACAVCSYSVAFASSPVGPGLVGEHQRLPGGGLQLLDLGHLPGQLHLQLPLVADHGRGLLDQAWCWRCASSIACWICTFGSACSSILAPNEAIRYSSP